MSVKNLVSRSISFIKAHTQLIEAEQSMRAWRDSQDFIYDNTELNTRVYPDHWELRRDVFDMRIDDGAILEFGVFKASSTNFFAKMMVEAGDSRSLVGFDSFAGFSEDWTGVEKSFPKDRFDLSGNYPKVEANVQLVDGYIEKTLPKYLQENQIETVAFVHIDTDTYSPAKTALSLLQPYFRPGTIVLFDELLGYPNWRSHEYKALTETLDRDSYEYLAFGVSGPRAKLIKSAIRIL